MNAFGQAVETSFLLGGNVRWNAALAGMDSDSDGFTNGQELGDPNGTGTPTPGARVTNPGDPNSKPQVQNQVPVFSSVPDQTVQEGSFLTFSVQASDADKDAITYSAADLPSGANFAGNALSWTPNFDQGGKTYEVSFAASDGKGSASLKVKISVTNVDRPASLGSYVPNRLLVASAPGDTLRFSVSATDPDGDPITYAWTVNGSNRPDTGPSFLLTVSQGTGDDTVSATIASSGNPIVQTWTVAKALKGDFDGDGQVGFADFLAFVAVFGKTASEPGFDARFDLNGNLAVDFADFLEFVRFFGLSIR